MSRCGDRQLQHSPSFHTGCEVERRTTLSLAFIPNLCCHLEHLGKGSEQGLAQQGAGFGAALGWCCDTVRLFLGLHLTESGGASPQCDHLIPGLHFQSSLGAVVCPAVLPGQPDPQHQALFEQQWIPCASVPLPIQPAPALPTGFCHKALKQKYFSLGRWHECTEQLPELGSDRAAQGALMTACGQQGFQEETSSLKKVTKVFSGRDLLT